MYTIKKFTTKKDVRKQLEDSGVNIKMPFDCNGEFDVEKDPFDGKDIYGFDGKKIDKKKKTKEFFETISTKLKRKTLKIT